MRGIDTQVRQIRRRVFKEVANLAYTSENLKDDVEALRLLVDKACICCVHTRTMDMELKLAESDVIRMRHKYEDDYARRKDEM